MDGVGHAERALHMHCRLAMRACGTMTPRRMLSPGRWPAATSLAKG